VPVPVAVRVAAVEARAADLRQPAVGALVLRAGVAIAEIAGQVERQRRGEACGLRDGLRMVGEAGGHRLRGREEVGVVAAAQRL
jgi:hypothetical protein